MHTFTLTLVEKMRRATTSTAKILDIWASAVKDGSSSSVEWLIARGVP